MRMYLLYFQINFIPEETIFLLNFPDKRNLNFSSINDELYF